MIEDLKQVRDALERCVFNFELADKDGNFGLIQQSNEALATLDRIIAEQKLVPQGWNTIDSAPKDGTEILLALWSGHPEHKTSFCWAINGHYKDGFFYSKDPMIGKLASPTHWQHITAQKPAQPEKLDVEALKFSVLLAVSPDGDHTEVSGAESLMIGKVIDHLAAHYNITEKGE